MWYANLLKEDKETQIMTTDKIFLETHIFQQTKQQLQHINKKHVNVWITRRRMGPLNDENKLQFDKKKNKVEKYQTL